MLCGVCALLGTQALAQSCASRDYIYLGSRVVAIETQPNLTLSSSSGNLTAVASSDSFDLLNASMSAASWTATVDTNQSWLSLQLNGQSVITFNGTTTACSDSRAGKSMIAYQVQANASADSRTATITVASSTYNLIFTVNQSGSG